MMILFIVIIDIIIIIIVIIEHHVKEIRLYLGPWEPWEVFEQGRDRARSAY